MNRLDSVYYGNTLLEWSIALGVTTGAVAVFYFLKHVLLRRLAIYAQQAATPVARVALEVFSDTKSLFLLILAVYLGAQFVDLPARVGRTVEGITVVALLLQAALWGNRGIVLWLRHVLQAKKETDAAGATTLSVLGFIGRVALWSIVLLMMLANLGFDITALVASLGIGGIAVALAVQNILGDIFASLSIAIDKPFVIGDFIIVGDLMGTVEYIGLKTTRIRSLSGEQIVFSNADLLASRIRNFKRMYERRVVFRFGVVYETPRSKSSSASPPWYAKSSRRRNTRASTAPTSKSTANSRSTSRWSITSAARITSSTWTSSRPSTSPSSAASRRKVSQFAYPTRTLYVSHAPGQRASPSFLQENPQHG